MPTRTGTAENPQEYADGWDKLEAGVDTKELLSAIYRAEVLEAVAEAARIPSSDGASRRARARWPARSAGSSWSRRRWPR